MARVAEDVHDDFFHISVTTSTQDKPWGKYMSSVHVMIDKYLKVFFSISIMIIGILGLLQGFSLVFALLSICAIPSNLSLLFFTFM